MKTAKPTMLDDTHAVQMRELMDEVMRNPADLPDANAVMAAICCASAQFSTHPSLELALLIEELTYTLNSPNYAQTPLMKCVAERLMQQWGDIVDAQESHLLNDEHLMPICH